MADVSGITAALPQQTMQNPLQQYSTIQGIVNAQQQNKLMQQELLNKQQDLANAQLTNETGQTNLAWTKRVNSAKALLGLNSQLDDDMLKNAPDLLEGLRADHNIPDSVYNQIKADIQNGDARALRGHIGTGIVSTMSGPEGVQAVYGTPRESTTASGQTQMVQPPGILAPPGTPTRNLGTPFGGGLSPAEGAQRVTGSPGLNGEPTTVPLRSVTPPIGSPTGAAPPAQTGATPSVDVKPPVQSAIPGQMVTGTPADFDSNVKMGNALNARADQVAPNKAQLSLLSDDLNRINLMGTGAARDAAVNSFINKYTGFGITMSPEQIAAADSFKKIATQIAMAQAAQGGGTDMQTATSMMANPNLDLSKLSNEQILSRLQGNEDYIMAKNQAWNTWRQTHGVGDYRNFSQWFNQVSSPLVFQHENMSASDAQQFRKSYNPEQLQKQREFAIQQGWLKRRSTE